MTHKIVKCRSCRNIVAQCRCMDHKTVIELIPRCEKCKKRQRFTDECLNRVRIAGLMDAYEGTYWLGEHARIDIPELAIRLRSALEYIRKIAKTNEDLDFADSLENIPCL